MPVTTRAAIAFAAHKPLEIHEVTVADPGPGQVMIRLLASGLCHSDLHVLEGKTGMQFPIVLGHEGVGEVTAVGEGVTDFAPGDRVIPFIVPDCGECGFCRSGRTNLCVKLESRWRPPTSPFTFAGAPVRPFLGVGSFAEVTVVTADMLVKVDRAARADHACCIGCGVTTGLGAALISAKVTPGASVVVIGAGGVGLSVVQGARLAGAGRIIAVDTNPAKAEIARRLGATDFINSREVEDVAAEVRKLTGMGADFAFECVGLPALAKQLALEVTNPAWGVAVNVGVMPVGEQLVTTPNSLMFGRRWSGTLMGGAKRQDVARFVDMYVAGEFGLDELVSHRLTHDDINRGFELMRSGGSVRSVVVYGQ